MRSEPGNRIAVQLGHTFESLPMRSAMIKDTQPFYHEDHTLRHKTRIKSLYAEFVNPGNLQFEDF
jgi:hypothetical protein